MKKLNLAFAILIAFVTLTSCNNKTELTPQQSLVQNGPWVIDHLELLNVVNHGNTDFNEQEILANMNAKLTADYIHTFAFNEDRTGNITTVLKSTGDVDDVITFTWEVTVDNELKINMNEGGDITTFINLVITKKQLEFTFSSQKIVTDVTGDIKYVCVTQSN